jgi:hypothetical protein
VLRCGWGRRASGVVAVFGLSWWLGGCSPTYNWRESVHEGVPLRALMPCKPERADRSVPLLGPERPALTLRMMSCQVGGGTFAVAAVQLPRAELAASAMQQWTQAAWVSLKQSVPAGAAMPLGWSGQSVSWVGASIAQSWAGPGLNHQGQPLQVHLRLGAQGVWLVQAAWYGQQADAEVRDSFFDALRFESVQ